MSRYIVKFPKKADRQTIEYKVHRVSSYCASFGG